MIGKMILVALFPIAVYAFLCLFFYVAQDKLLYHPVKEESRLPEMQQTYPALTEVSYSLPEGKRLTAWYHKPTKKKKIILFAHGNSYSVSHFTSKITPWIDKGYGVLAFEYEGFGHLSGEPSQAVLERDGKTAVKWLESQGYKHKDIILYGHSMGTYVVTFLAAEMGQKEPFDAVVLDSPFLSLTQAAYDASKALLFVGLPIKWLIKDTYPTQELIQKINTRVFIGHGKKDKVIPYYQGVQLFNRALKEKAFFSSDVAGHNTLPQNGFFDALWKWL